MRRRFVYGGADAGGAPRQRLPGHRRLPRGRRGGIRRPPARRGPRGRAAAGPRADADRRAGRSRPAPALAPRPRQGPPPLRVRDVRTPGRALAVAVRAGGAARAAALVRRRDARRRRARRPRLHDRMSPFLRNLLILAAVAIVVLNLEVAVVTAGALLRLAFIIAIAVVAYFMWRDMGRREIQLWPARAQSVFYGAVALLVVDIGWWMLTGPSGRDALVGLVVGAICIYVGVRTWRDQRTYL